MKMVLALLVSMSFVSVAQAKKMSRKEAKAACQSEMPEASKREVTKCVKKKMK